MTPQRFKPLSEVRYEESICYGSGELAFVQGFDSGIEEMKNRAQVLERTIHGLISLYEKKKDDLMANTLKESLEQYKQSIGE